MIVGVDEAGRGPLAGPVVAAAVVLCPDGIEGLGDSKALSEKRRIALEAEIKARCRWAVGVVNVDDIDRLNIFGATMLAMALAVEALVAEIRHAELVSASMEHGSDQRITSGEGCPWTLKQVQGDVDCDIEVLIDGNMTPQDRTPRWRWPARAIVGGDAIEPCISAASIIAKQHRDRMMVEACAAHPGYGFAQHKGYGTAQHLAALRALGPCPIHRRSFAPVAQLVML